VREDRALEVVPRVVGSPDEHGRLGAYGRFGDVERSVPLFVCGDVSVDREAIVVSLDQADLDVCVGSHALELDCCTDRVRVLVVLQDGVASGRSLRASSDAAEVAEILEVRPEDVEPLGCALVSDSESGRLSACVSRAKKNEVGLPSPTGTPVWRPPTLSQSGAASKRGRRDLRCNG